MSAESAISWLARTVDGKTWHQGHTLNPWSGCYIKSDGCRECYAKNLPPAMRRGAVWGPREMRVLAPDSYLAQVHAWNRAAEKLGIRMPVFCASTADIFERHAVESERERLNGQRAKVWALVAATPWLDWLFLTKEPENILDMIPAEWAANGCPANVWMGCTVESDKNRGRIDYLREVPAVVRFLSVEPMVGPLHPDLRGIHWVLCGGESGRGVNVRPMHPQWARSLRDQCVAAGVAFHFKRWGEWAPHDGVTPYTTADGAAGTPPAYIMGSDGTLNCFRSPSIPDPVPMLRPGKKATGRILDGRTWDELPEAPRG